MKAFFPMVSACMLLGACSANPGGGTPVAAPVTADDASKQLDTALTAWTSGDAAKIDALYAADVAGFDVTMPDLITDRAEWTKTAQAFAAMKFDKMRVAARRIQIVGPDAFVTHVAGELYQSADPAKSFAIRCTDVFHRSADGKWPIVAEHCSQRPAT